MPTMLQSSNFSVVLSMYGDVGPLRWLYMLLIALVYIAMTVCNIILVFVIITDRSLHQPMYLFLLSQFCNELQGGNIILPFLFFQLMQDDHSISHSFCFIQIFFIFTYGNVALITFGVMSYDRFLAICRPLQYHTSMSPQKALKLLAGVWSFVLLEVLCMVSLSAPLKLCNNIVPKVYCDNYSMVRLACGDTSVNNVYGLTYTFLVLLTLPSLIVYSYVRIISVCMRGSTQTRHKALNTCGPQLASLLNLAIGSFFELIQSRFNMSAVPDTARIFLSLHFLVCPPLVNPLIYGLNLAKVRNSCKLQLSKLWTKLLKEHH